MLLKLREGQQDRHSLCSERQLNLPCSVFVGPRREPRLPYAPNQGGQSKDSGQATLLFVKWIAGDNPPPHSIPPRKGWGAQCHKSVSLWPYVRYSRDKAVPTNGKADSGSLTSAPRRVFALPDRSIARSVWVPEKLLGVIHYILSWTAADIAALYE